MESNILTGLSREIGIAPELIIREAWEMVILDKLSQFNICKNLVFKGGTALRLAYNSPRFSEDLDFDLSQKTDFKDFAGAIKKIVAGLAEAKLKDLAEKYATYLAQISINDESLSRSISVKIEISTRNTRKPDYSEVKLIVSPASRLQVLLAVARLPEIKKEKARAAQTRRQPRDLFDLWYIAQLERKPWTKPDYGLEPKEVKRELNKYLPEKYRPIIKELI